MVIVTCIYPLNVQAVGSYHIAIQTCMANISFYFTITQSANIAYKQHLNQEFKVTMDGPSKFVPTTANSFNQSVILNIC